MTKSPHPAKKAMRSRRTSIWEKVMRGTVSPARMGISATVSSPAVTVRVPSRSPAATGAYADPASSTVWVKAPALDFSSSSTFPSPSTGCTVAWVPSSTGMGGRASSGTMAFKA